MPIKNPKYDAAISFLTEDEGTAAAIERKLKEGLNVFFYPRKQEDLAGTDGMETMRKPFLDESRVTVVLFRERWGKTPWTRVEEAAIKDACLERGWEHLFFIALDKTSKFPVWLPKTHVRFNFEDFGIDGAVGAIKARVLEQGGELEPLTPLKRAAILQEDQKFLRDKARMNSEEGTQRIFDAVTELFKRIEQQCEEINSQHTLRSKIRHDKELQHGLQRQTLSLTDGFVSLTLVWHQPYTSSTERSALYIREFNGGLLFRHEFSQRMYLNQPQELNSAEYEPDLSLSREFGWKLKNNSEKFISSISLADKCVIDFLNLMNHFTNGAIKPRGFS